MTGACSLKIVFIIIIYYFIESYSLYCDKDEHLQANVVKSLNVGELFSYSVEFFLDLVCRGKKGKD